MDNIEKKLYHDLSLDIEIPDMCEKIIKETLNNNKKVYSLIKIILTSCASILLTIGVVYAGTNIYEKIWKKPEKVIGFYSEIGNNTITQEQMEKVMSEEEAKEKAKDILKNFGYEKETIKSINIENNPYNYDLSWYIETSNNILMDFNAVGENSFNIYFSNVLNNDIHQCRTTKEEAKKTAIDLCKKYGYNTEKYNKIDITYNLETEKESYIWYVEFFKEYDGIINPYESIEIAFIPELNYIYYFYVRDLEYENNQVLVTKEQAEKIVVDTEEKINVGSKIKNINSNLAIEKMNGDAYKRITNYNQYYKEKHEREYPLKNI